MYGINNDLDCANNMGGCPRLKALGGDLGNFQLWNLYTFCFA